MTERSQAVRLPQEFRFDTDCVDVKGRTPFSAAYQDWAGYFERTPRVGEDFVAAIEEMRRNPLPLEERESFD